VNGRNYIQLKLKDLISKAGVRLIEVYVSQAEGLDLHYAHMGEVGLYYDATIYDENKIGAFFTGLGFELLTDPEDELVERIRIAAIELIHYASNVNSLIRNSDYISERLQMPYDKLSRIFSKKKSVTLEAYLIKLKIEKAKELIASDKYTLSEISYMLEYSSVQYLSNQFKKVTGVTVSQFKESPNTFRIPIEDL
jgi:AraC family transcriptional regulator